MARSCIFCGGGPVTSEHVWPEWLTELFPTTRVRVTFSEFPTMERVEKTIEQTYRGVCKKCNNGWMSTLERQAAPVLKPMLAGEMVTVSEEHQQLISAWAVKTAMVFEHAMPGQKIYWRDNERLSFSEAPHFPPGDTGVLVGAYTGSYLALFSGGERIFTPKSAESEPFPATRATVAVGRLVLQVQSHRAVEVNGRMAFAPTPGYERTQLFWPVEAERVWPHAEPFDDESLEAFRAVKFPEPPS